MLLFRSCSTTAADEWKMCDGENVQKITFFLLFFSANALFYLWLLAALSPIYIYMRCSSSAFFGFNNAVFHIWLTQAVQTNL